MPDLPADSVASAESSNARPIWLRFAVAVGAVVVFALIRLRAHKVGILWAVAWSSSSFPRS